MLQAPYQQFSRHLLDKNANQEAMTASAVISRQPSLYETVHLQERLFEVQKPYPKKRLVVENNSSLAYVTECYRSKETTIRIFDVNSDYGCLDKKNWVPNRIVSKIDAISKGVLIARRKLVHESSSKAKVDTACNNHYIMFRKESADLPTKQEEDNKPECSSGVFSDNQNLLQSIDRPISDFSLGEDEFPLEPSTHDGSISFDTEALTTLRKITVADVTDSIRDLILSSASVSPRSNSSMPSTSVVDSDATLSEPPDLTLRPISPCDSEKEINNINFQIIQNRRVLASNRDDDDDDDDYDDEDDDDDDDESEDEVTAVSFDKELMPDDDTANAASENQPRKGKWKRLLSSKERRGSGNSDTSDVRPSIPVHKPEKLKFNPIASTAKYLVDDTKGKERVQEDEENLRDDSEITATQLSRVSKKNRTRKRIKKKIEEANQELFRDE